MKSVQLPNGRKLNFPDDTSEDEMASAIDSNFPEYAQKTDPPKENFLGNIMEMIKNAGSYAPQVNEDLAKNQPIGGDLGKGIAKLGINTAQTLGNLPYYLDQARAHAVAEMGNLPDQIKGLFSDKPSQSPRYTPQGVLNRVDFDADKIVGNDPNTMTTRNKVVQAIPDLAATFALPEARLGQLGESIANIPKYGKYLKTALANAIPQGIFAASQSPDDKINSGLEAGATVAPFSILAQAVSEGSPAIRALSKGLLAAGAGGLGYAGAKATGQGNLTSALIGGGLGLGTLTGHTLFPNATQDVLKGVEGTDYQPVLDAAKRINLKYITPAEASGNTYAAATQGSVGKTAEGSQKLMAAGQERLGSEKDAINNFLGTVFNKEKLGSKVDELYAIARPKTVPENDLTKLQDNKVFTQAVKNVEKSPAFQESLKGVPENSVDYLDHVKQAMDDMIENSPKKEGRIIQKARKELIDVTDTAAPEYKEARGLAERQITRQKVEDIFDRRPITGTNFSRFLQSGKNYNKLQFNLRNVPEAQQQLADMKLVFERLIPTPTLKGSAALSSTSMSKSRSSTQDLKTQLKEILTGNKYDKNAVELITNPQWADELAKLKNQTNKEKLVGSLVNLFGKVAAQNQ